MELYSAEAKAIGTQIAEWLEHPQYELEATFGNRGVVDATTFITVAKRLRTKGFTSLPQEDRLTITTKEHIRFTLSGLGIIQRYCTTDSLSDLPFTAMIKDRAAANANVDLEEYDVRIKNRREIPLANDDAAIKKLQDVWDRVPKFFRMMRRWTFEGEGVVFDLSIVRSTRRTTSASAWQRRFRDQDIMQSAPTYELELELQHVKDDDAATALKRLVKGMGEVLRGIQKNSILIRTSTRTKVLGAYRELTGDEKFRGPAPVTLQKKNFSLEREEGEPNIRDGYNVTDKADGLRCMAFCDSKGEMFLIDMGMRNVYRTGMANPECRLSLVDGEWVTLTADKKPINQFLAFDIFYATDKTDVSRLPFQPPAKDRELESRWGQLKAWSSKWNKGGGPTRLVPSITAQTQLQVSMKDFIFGRPGDVSIFRAAARILDTARIYYTDGLIFTSNTKGLPQAPGATFYEQLKWKPSEDNTIDFLVTTVKKGDSKTVEEITQSIKEGTGEMVSYKTLRLFVGSTQENASDIILNMLDLPKKERAAGAARGAYKPILFTPKDFPDSMASTCYLETHEDPDTGSFYTLTEDTEEPIQDRTIVEMAYDPRKEPGWRWRPLRVRMDKTERLQSGQLGSTLNSEKVANSVWSSIYDPITKHMIRTGNEEPSDEEQRELIYGKEESGYAKKYFERKASKEDKLLVRGMRDFHNKWIKERILYGAGLSEKGKTLIDTSCGVGADLRIWRMRGVAFVLGVDYSGENIRGSGDTIYQRYMEAMITAGGRDRIAPMVFAIGNSKKNYANGDAGETAMDKDILRSVLGKVRPTGQIPPFVAEMGASRLKAGTDCMSCMFALHYFFDNAESLRGFMKNISDNLKVGGYFIGTCFDGEKVFDLLRSVSKGGSVTGTESDSIIWSIKKQYDEDDIPEGEEGLGLAIDVEFVTIGSTHREYLVPFPLLVQAMAAVGCELLDAKDLRALKMNASTHLFSESYEMAKKAGMNYAMPDVVKNFSFLNRWFVFRRKRVAGGLEEAGLSLPTIRQAAAQGMPSAVRAATASAIGRPPLNTVEGDEEAEEEADAPAAAAGPAAAAAPLGRTVPVAPGRLAPDVPTYAQGELFQFFPEAAEKDVLGIKDKGAGQWLSPTAPFPIQDPYDETTTYPTLNHYLAAMQYRVASSTPEVAATLLGREGTIHQKFLNTRLLESESGTKPIPEKRDKELLKQEATEVREAVRPSTFKKYKSVFNAADWATKKDEVLRAGLKQRWEKDARFRRIVQAAMDQGKTLLYYAPGANSSNMGGIRKNTGEIQGENLIGKIIMELAAGEDA